MNLLYPNLPVLTYAVSDNGEGEISLIETLYNSPLLLDLISTDRATIIFIFREKDYEIQ